VRKAQETADEIAAVLPVLQVLRALAAFAVPPFSPVETRLEMLEKEDASDPHVALALQHARADLKAFQQTTRYARLDELAYLCREHFVSEFRGLPGKMRLETFEAIADKHCKAVAGKLGMSGGCRLPENIMTVFMATMDMPPECTRFAEVVVSILRE
jgi:hypothetical protein